MRASEDPSATLGASPTAPAAVPVAAVERTRKPLVCFGPFVFDPNGQALRRGADELTLPPRVLSVLELLLHRAGDLVPRQELIDSVWKEAFVTDTSLAEAISFLRQTLGDDSQSPTYIQTVHRRGYRFVAPIETRAADTARPALNRSAAAVEPERVSPSIGGALVPWSVAALLGALAIAAIWQLTHQNDSTPPAAARFVVTLPGNARLDDRGPALAFSPDGTQLAWAACVGRDCRLYTRPLAELDGAAMAGTDDASGPFFSPDGRWIGFFAGGKLKKVPASGGSSTAIADAAHAQGATWTSDGRIVFASARTGGLMQVAADGGQPEPLTTPRPDQGEVRHAWPSIAPDGHTLLFTVMTSLDDRAPGRLAMARLDRGNRSPAWSTALSGIGIAQAAGRDLLVFSRGPDLQAVTFDPIRSTISGVPRTVVSPVGGSQGLSHFAISGSGALAYAQGPSNTPDLGLAWWSPSGTTPVVEGVRPGSASVVSADGRSIAWASSLDADRSDIWVGDLQRGAVTRLTHDGLNVSPAWSADGRTVYFARRDTGAFRLMAVAADGGKPNALPATDRPAFPFSTSSDGRTLAFVQADPATRADIRTMPVGGGAAAQPVVQTPFDETAPAFSSTGFLAYQSDEAGRWDVYAQRMRDAKRVVVSTTGGERPFWAADGRTLFYRTGTRLMKASIGEDLQVSSPSPVLDLPDATVIGVAPDGRFLIERRPPAAASAVIALEWSRDVRALLGPPAARLPR